MWFSHRTLYSILFFVLSMTLVAVVRPPWTVEGPRHQSSNPQKHGRTKAFGIGPDRTMFSIGVISIGLAIVTFYTFALIDLIYA